MNLVLLLPGYLDSCDYLHWKTFDKRLTELGYVVERIDPCHLWETGEVNSYTVTNYLNHVIERIEFYKSENLQNLILIGHSLGGSIAIILGNRINAVTHIIALNATPDSTTSIHHWKNKQPRVSKRELPDNPNSFRYFEIPYTFIEDALKYSAQDEIKNIYKPIMIFVSEKDERVPKDRAELIISNANNPYVVKQPNLGHEFRYTQREADLVMNEIERFIKNLIKIK